jgi:hypothetical protein
MLHWRGCKCGYLYAQLDTCSVFVQRERASLTAGHIHQCVYSNCPVTLIPQPCRHRDLSPHSSHTGVHTIQRCYCCSWHSALQRRSTSAAAAALLTLPLTIMLLLHSCTACRPQAAIAHLAIDYHATASFVHHCRPPAAIAHLAIHLHHCCCVHRVQAASSCRVRWSCSCRA